MNEIVLLLIALLLVLGVRLVPSWLNPLTGSDDGFHLLLRREIRRNGFRVPGKLDVCLLDQRLTYPWLYHQVIAFLPESWLRHIPALPSAIIDGVHSLLAFYAGGWLASTLRFPDCAPWAGFLSALLFGVNPALLAQGMGPRAYHATPRPFGELLFSLSVFSGVLAIYHASWGWALFSAMAGGAMLLSSKFAAQVMLFFVPFLALVPGMAVLLLLVPASFIAALLFSRGRYLEIFRGQIAHLRYFRRTLQYTFSPVVGRNSWSGIERIWSAIRAQGLMSKATMRAVGYVYATNSYLLALSRGGLYLVWFILCGTSAFRAILHIGQPPVVGLAAWALAWILPFVLTSTKHVRFLGEAERYAEFSVLPVAVLVGTGLAVTSFSALVGIVLGLYALCAAGVIGYAWAVDARANQNKHDARAQLLDFLKTLPSKSLLLGVPAMQVLCPLASLLPHRYADITTDGAQWEDIIERRFDGYPWPKPDWNMWRELGVQYVVTYAPEYLRQHRPSLPYSQIPLRLIYVNPDYRVYAYEGEPV